MDINYLDTIRTLELKVVIENISLKANADKGSKLKVLEIGAGTGTQALKLSEYGFTVEAIDLKESNYSECRVWPITDYDGKNIPFPDKYFDVVFSSSVLEHIFHLEEFQIEMQRVLKHDGLAVHVVPSGAWRFWTNLTHYPNMVKLSYIAIFKRLKKASKNYSQILPDSKTSKSKKYSVAELLIKTFFPERHGETGSAVSEMYYFSKKRWSNVFQQSGWRIIKVGTNNLFYSGNVLFGKKIPFTLRMRLSQLFGSSCHIFLLSPR